MYLVKELSDFQLLDNFNLVGEPGIEPDLYAPEAYVLPVYYSPIDFFDNRFITILADMKFFHFAFFIRRAK